MTILEDHSPATMEMRPLAPTDGRLLAEFGRSFSPETQYLRFFSNSTGTVDRWIVALLGADQDRHLVECLLHRDTFGTVIVGVAEVVRIAAEPDAGEFAIAVADDWQGLGAGSMLIRRMVRRSIEGGIERWKVDRLGSNRTLAALLAQAGPTEKLTAGYGIVTSVHRLDRKSGEGGI